MTNELKTILFLHILAAMAMVGGIFGFLLLYLRARTADDAADLRSTLLNARLLQRRLVLPGAGLAGLIGLLLMWRYDARGVFDAGRQGWIHISILLWIVTNVLAVVAGRYTRRAEELASAGDGRELAAARAQLNAGPVAGLILLNSLIALVLVYLMVFQPFAGG